MKRPLTRWALSIALVLAGGAQATPAQFRFEEGIARGPGARLELYREQHWLRSGQGRLQERLVLYRCPDGTAFARKRVDYRASATTPAFELEDRRNGYREGLRRGADTSLFYRSGSEAAERSAALGGGAVVADAGFDEFVRKHWATLVSGAAVPLEFAIPSRLRTLSFSVRRAGQARIAGEQAWVFRMKLDGWLGLIVPAIDVSYGQTSQRLLRFEGLSNLRDDRGQDQLLVSIDFAKPATTTDEAHWLAAWRTPLSACATGRKTGRLPRVDWRDVSRPALATRNPAQHRQHHPPVQQHGGRVAPAWATGLRAG